MTVRIFPFPTWTFTKDTALAEDSKGRGMAWLLVRSLCDNSLTWDQLAQYSSTIFLEPRHTRWGWVVSTTLRPRLPRKDPISIVHEAGWASEPVWIGAENLPPPPGFDRRTFQPIESRYTYYAIQAAKPYTHSVKNRVHLHLKII
jgi:hypothetical protein